MSGLLARSRVAAALVTLAVAMGIQAVSSSQVANAVPSADGARVAFVKVVGGFSQIYTMNPDGTDVEALPGQPASANNTDPASSPDGTKIAFTSNSGGSGDLNVWVIGLDGTGLTQLTTDPGNDSAPAWSPNGVTIAYQSDTGGNLNVWLMNAADGTGQHALTTNPASDSQPAWFPTGSRIAFQSNRTGNSDIYAINSNGTSLKHVTTSTAPDTQPTVGTGGGTIAFTSRRNGNTDIYTVPAGGGTNTRVTSNAAVDSQPAFSTDGRWLAFTSNRTGVNQVFADPRPSGTTKQLTTDTANPASEADYSPYAYPSPTWSNRLTGSQTGGQNNYPNAIAVSPDGSKVFSAGGVFTSGRDVDGYVSAYSSTGTYLWNETFNAPGFGYSYGGAYALAVSPDSSKVYVGGYAGNDMFVGEYNAASGALINSTKIPHATFATVWAMAASPDGSTLYVAGTQYGTTNLPQGSDTISLSTTTLAPNWSQYYSKADPYIGAMQLSPSGDTVYWTGNHYGAKVSDPAEDDYFTIAYSSSGSAKWHMTYNTPVGGEDEAGALAVSPDGSRVYVTGWSWGGPSDKSDAATVSYATSDGSFQWEQRYNSPAHSYDWGDSLAVSPDGNTVYVAGGRSRSVSGKLTNDYETTALNSASGEVNWVRFYNGPGDYFKNDAGDSAYAVNVSPDGSHIFITGQSYRTGTSFDLTTVGYDTSGNQLWIGRYNGPNNGPEYAPFAAMSPDGSTLYVTGQSKGTTYYAGATLAWDLSTVPAVIPAVGTGARLAHSSTDGDGALGSVGPASKGSSAAGAPPGLAAKRQLEALLRSR